MNSYGVLNTREIKKREYNYLWSPLAQRKHCIVHLHVFFLVAVVGCQTREYLATISRVQKAEALFVVFMSIIYSSHLFFYFRTALHRVTIPTYLMEILLTVVHVQLKLLSSYFRSFFFILTMFL